MNEKGFPVKALLLLDNAPVHPDAASLISKEGSIKTMFHLPNTTALVTSQLRAKHAAGWS